MLLRVILQNMLSYREPTQFDMFPNPKRQQLSHHVIDGTINTLKLAAIYGGNGAGKSNLIYAMGFVQNFVLDEFFISNTDLSKYVHALTDDHATSLSMLIEFSIRGKYYIYEIEISKDGVIEKELLKVSGLGKKRSKTIFTRTRSQISFPRAPKESLQKAIDTLLESNPSSSTLSLNKRFPIMDSEDVKNAIDWFEHNLKIVPLHADIKYIITLMHQNQELLTFSKNTLDSIDLGINGLRTQEQPIDEYYKSHPQIQKEFDKEILKGSTSDSFGVTTFKDSKPNFDVIVENGINKIRELVFAQKGSHGKEYEMGISSQSDGTIRLLMLMPVFYSLMRDDVTVFVDEINFPIHPILIKALIRSFSLNERTKGQLIFTTHEVELMEGDILRADEVWIAEKSDGNTSLYSVNEFRPHKNFSLKSGYMEGRFGGVPYIERLINQLS